MDIDSVDLQIGVLRPVADPQALEEFLVEPAAFDNRPQVSPMLRGAVDGDRNTALILAIKGGHEKAFNVLLASAQVNQELPWLM